ncbi:MAG: hypothetical protein J6M62_02460 [Selenomonadaceae bacterium]|nr:hypothetical protein [Selenomonadaceae bacterium]MBP3723788.1 hypothetical protein [Selenomonadaceae bacterium]
MSEIKEAVREVEPWQWGIFAGAGFIGFAVGVAVVFWIKYTLAIQGVYKSAF